MRRSKTGQVHAGSVGVSRSAAGFQHGAPSAGCTTPPRPRVL